MTTQNCIGLSQSFVWRSKDTAPEDDTALKACQKDRQRRKAEQLTKCLPPSPPQRQPPQPVLSVAHACAWLQLNVVVQGPQAPTARTLCSTYRTLSGPKIYPGQHQTARMRRWEFTANFIFRLSTVKLTLRTRKQVRAKGGPAASRRRLHRWTGCASTLQCTSP